jgi:hypothetical protein
MTATSRARRVNRASQSSVRESGTLSIPRSLGTISKIRRSLVFTVNPTPADQGLQYDFALNDVPNSAEFTQLFTHWRLAKAIMRLTFVSVRTADTTYGMTVYYGCDPLVVGPTTLPAATQLPHQSWAPTQSKTTLVVTAPVAAIGLVSSGPGAGATVNNYSLPRGIWLSTAQPNTAYGNFWLYIRNWNTVFNTQYSLEIEQTFELEFCGTQ